MPRDVISRTPPTPPYDDRIIPCTISKYTAEKLDNPSGAASQPIAKNSPHTAYAMWFIMFLPKHSKFVNHPNPQINGLLVQKNHKNPFFAVADGSHDVLRGKSPGTCLNPETRPAFQRQAMLPLALAGTECSCKADCIGLQSTNLTCRKFWKGQTWRCGPHEKSKWVNKMTVIYGISSLVYGIIWDYMGLYGIIWDYI